MEKIKCECGHINHEGTVLCEACGKPIQGNQHIDGNDDRKLLDMRYDGSARRSKTYKRTLVDKVWAWFSSVKVGVWLIVVALIASAVGTIYPQEPHIQSPLPAEVYYKDEYGMAGQIYYQLGFHNLYSSWWYITLIALIGISLIICSIDRVVPLHRALKNQSPKRHEVFIRRQRLFSESTSATSEDQNRMVENLKKKRYKITSENGHIMAEKNRFSRWGPYVNHIGLIIILLAAILRMFPFFYSEGYVWVREGETKIIPSTQQEYYIENKEFIYETYDRNDERFQEALENEEFDVPSNFQTNAVVYKVKGDTIAGQEPELEPVSEGEIRLNQPLTFDGYSIFQAGSQIQSEYASIELELSDAEGNAIKEFEYDTGEAPQKIDLGDGYQMEVEEWYPQFTITDEGASSDSKYPRNPGIIFNLSGPENEDGERFFYLEQEVLPLSEGGVYDVSYSDSELITASGLSVKKDRTLWMFGLGAAIFLIGVSQGLYWHHRRIWIQPKEKGILLAAHTNKNWHGIKQDIEQSIEKTKINMTEDQQELKE
ncbi:cytochrome C biogenesis protein [Halalkalibacillus sediminis]|uniref:Cytochrome C biogenesis protein n=1 Tax=Halalkalibacillus sediminis TaxID=2018042 RepID=A0A2I0QX13_9BACI|nr:cytochrome c biogenesis protein ResB [Halalkalibacillus sediminis]PKR78886.1 cytochrome C biogenesis protein [Halalkalibacillus sediminis]